MNFSNKFLAGLVVGAAAGAAVAIFLQTDKGKEVITKIKDAASDAGDNLKKYANKVEDELHGAFKKGRQFADDLKNKAADASL